VLLVGKNVWFTSRSAAYTILFSNMIREAKNNYAKRFPHFYAQMISEDMYQIVHLEVQSGEGGQRRKTGQNIDKRYTTPERLYFCFVLGVTVPELPQLLPDINNMASNVFGNGKKGINKMFDGRYYYNSIDSTNVSHEFISYCYCFILYCRNYRYNITKYAIFRMLEIFIITDRILAIGYDPNDLYNRLKRDLDAK